MVMAEAGMSALSSTPTQLTTHAPAEPTNSRASSSPAERSAFVPSVSTPSAHTLPTKAVRGVAACTKYLGPSSLTLAASGMRATSPLGGGASLARPTSPSAFATHHCTHRQ